MIKWYNDPDPSAKLIAEKDAYKMIDEVILGKITKINLDRQRVAETNVLDMMQNSSIIYHPESLTEMQFICLITFLMFTLREI